MKRLIMIMCIIFVLAGCQSNESVTTPATIDDSNSDIARKPLVQPIEMELHDAGFIPDEIYVYQGDTVKLMIKSYDVDRGISIPELGVEYRLPADESVIVEFVVDKKGEFNYLCSINCNGENSNSGTQYNNNLALEGKLVVR